MQNHFFSTICQVVCTLHTSTNFRLIDLPFLYLYLQQNITHIISLTLSKTVQQLSTILLQSPHKSQSTICSNHFNIIPQFNSLYIASLFLNNSYFQNGAYRHIWLNMLTLTTHFYGLASFGDPTMLTSSIMPSNLYQKYGAHRHIWLNTLAPATHFHGLASFGDPTILTSSVMPPNL